VSSAPLPEVARQNIRAIRELEARAERKRTRGDRLTDAVTRFAGSFLFLFLQVFVIGTWIGANLLLDKDDQFDPFPFDFLVMLLDIEAILLATFVLMAQNRQNEESEQREHIHLQVALLAEQESTKMLQMLRAICQRLELNEVAGDPELAQMIGATRVAELARELEKVRDEAPGAEKPPGTEEAPE
jgi:uncharacterized membrane protein